MNVCFDSKACEVVENSARDRKVMIATKEMLSCNRLKLLESETHIGVSMWAFLFEFEKFSCQK